jgi:ribosome-binding protein aMBF1 (putative translation factor)
MAQFVKSKTRVELSPGDAVRVAREMLGLSQNALANKCKIPQSTISGIEADRITLGVERAKKLALALGVHPAVLLFPHWKLSKSSVA